MVHFHRSVHPTHTTRTRFRGAPTYKHTPELSLGVHRPVNMVPQAHVLLSLPFLAVPFRQPSLPFPSLAVPPSLPLPSRPALLSCTPTLLPHAKVNTFSDFDLRRTHARRIAHLSALLISILSLALRCQSPHGHCCTSSAKPVVPPLPLSQSPLEWSRSPRATTLFLPLVSNRFPDRLHRPMSHFEQMHPPDFITGARDVDAVSAARNHQTSHMTGSSWRGRRRSSTTTTMALTIPAIDKPNGTRRLDGILSTARRTGSASKDEVPRSRSTTHD